MLPQTTATASFFHAMAPILTGNILTVAFVYCFVTITQKELRGEEDGRLTYLWLIVMVLSFMLYGLYTWGVYPFKQESAVALELHGRRNELRARCGLHWRSDARFILSALDKAASAPLHD